jgi:adenylate cyclase
MRHELNPKIINAVVSEIEAACGSTLSADKRQAVTQRISQLLSIVAAEPHPTEHKQVSILLSDLRGFTALSEQYGPAEVIELLNRYFSRMCEVIERHEGTIDKFMGDGIMVLFGAPESGRDDLARAIACATEMQQVMSEVNALNAQLNMPQLFMGIGINTGTVVVGSIGSDLHREYTVIGDHVNLASRIEAHSLRGQVLLSEHSYQLAKDYIEVGDMREVFVKGKRDRVKLYELLATQRPYPMHVPTRDVRKSPRVLTNMPIVFQVVDGKSVLPTLHRGKIVDISYSGMRVLLNDPVPANTEIKCSIALSLLSQEITDLYGRILRVAKTLNEYECNLEFTSINHFGQQAVQQFVDQAIA